MAQATWEKTTAASQPAVKVQWKFIVAGVVLLAAIGYLIISQTTSGAQYFITVKDLVSDKKYVGQTVRLSGAVVGSTIKYDSKNLIMDFSIANVPDNAPDLGQALYEAANDPNAVRVAVRVENQVKPDLLKHEAQAILTGKLGEDGVFRATELLLKCPSRFEESDPNAAITDPNAAPKK